MRELAQDIPDWRFTEVIFLFNFAPHDLGVSSPKTCPGTVPSIWWLFSEVTSLKHRLSMLSKVQGGFYCQSKGLREHITCERCYKAFFFCPPTPPTLQGFLITAAWTHIHWKVFDKISSMWLTSLESSFSWSLPHWAPLFVVLGMKGMRQDYFTALRGPLTFRFWALQFCEERFSCAFIPRNSL